MEVAHMEEGTTINIRDCGGCGSTHESLAVKEYVTPRSPWTHWYTCPTTGDPVSVSIVVNDEKKLKIINDEILGQLVKAEDLGPFIVAIWSRDLLTGQINMWRHTSSGFPFVDLSDCLRLLKESFSEFGPPEGTDMEQAEIPPNVNLFEAN